ncbi:phage minor head protein [Lactococcus lactis]|uniref:phage minor head protein n=1 Tax=Lactococcus lactis TaxID=1358 RepID=UPI0018A96D8E|nr:phage minor head protein [Lactococcus lactis]
MLNVSNEIRQILGEPSINIAETIKSHVLTEGANGYNSVYYSLETGYNLDLNFHSLDNKFLTELMNSPVAGSTLSKRLYKYRDELASKISDAIARGMSFGYGYDRIALEVSTITEANYRQALRIARTEGGRVRSITTQKGYEEVKEKGVDLKKQWMATNDGRTRTDHQHVDGQIREVDKMFQVGGYDALGPHQVGVPSEDINCRCTTRPIVHGIMPTVRRNNITKKIGEWQSYDEWVKIKSKN